MVLRNPQIGIPGSREKFWTAIEQNMVEIQNIEPIVNAYVYLQKTEYGFLKKVIKKEIWNEYL